MARGAPRQAISLFSDIVQMFGWAQKRQPWRTLLIDGNPANLVEINKLVPSDCQKQRTRILSSIELQDLYQRFQKMTADYAALPAGEKYDGIRPLKPECWCRCRVHPVAEMSLIQSDSSQTFACAGLVASWRWVSLASTRGSIRHRR
jgi:hypothetical protein